MPADHDNRRAQESRLPTVKRRRGGGRATLTPAQNAELEARIAAEAERVEREMAKRAILHVAPP